MVFVAIVVTACGAGTSKESGQAKAAQQIDKHAASRTPYVPQHDVEFNNYNRAQRVYDSPDTIIWCSTTWGNPSAPIMTIPVAGKLTSSTVSFFPNTQENFDQYGNVITERKSVDGMYHGTPPPYRYGFTPGGQYVDFFNMPTVCTTALTKFQRSATRVALEVDPTVAAAQKTAEAQLAKGDRAGAQRTLEGALNGG